jgi:hypothetical protein
MQDPTRCPYCFEHFDSEDPVRERRKGVACKKCQQRHHLVCWQANGGKCMTKNCDSREYYEVVLTPYIPPEPPFILPPDPEPHRDPAPSKPQSSDLPWQMISLFLGGGLMLALVVIAVLLLTRYH